MRIIGGNFKGKKIITPIDKSTRPLKDIVRESIFNIIEHSKNEFVNLNRAKVLDLFSGTGSFGIECISRGAEKVIFFENYINSIKVLKKNLDLLKLNKHVKIVEKDVYEINQLHLNLKKFDLIFLDPPFKDNKINQLIEYFGVLKDKYNDSEENRNIHQNMLKFANDILKKSSKEFEKAPNWRHKKATRTNL